MSHKKREIVEVRVLNSLAFLKFKNIAIKTFAIEIRWLLVDCQIEVWLLVVLILLIFHNNEVFVYPHSVPDRV